MRRERNIPAKSTPPSGDSPRDSALAADCSVARSTVQSRHRSPWMLFSGLFLDLATFTWAMRLFWSSLARGISCKKYLFIMEIVNTQPAVLAGKMSANAFMPGTKM